METSLQNPRVASTEVADTIPSRFAATVARHSQRTAIRAPSGDWSYAELDQRSDAIARLILNRSGAVDEPVALLMSHDAPLISAILGTLKAGRMYVVLDAADPLPALTAVLADSRARLLLVDDAHRVIAQTLAGEQLQVARIGDDARSELSSAFPLPPVSADAGAWLMYTSGTTGLPKGVWQNHRGVLHQTDVYAGMIQPGPDDRFSLLTSGHLAASATAIFTAVLNGSMLCPFHVRSQGVDRLAAWMGAQRITIYHSVPTVFRHLLRTMRGNHPLETLRWIRLGGEPVRRGDAALFQERCPPQCRLLHALSSTETGLICALVVDQATELQEARLPVGRPVNGVGVEILDPNGQPMAAGHEGQIAVQSAGLAQGYWQRPEATQESFRSDPTDPRRRTFLTQDIGRVLPGGIIEHLGRMDHQVKIRGRRVDLTEVEAALQELSFVKEAAVLAPEDQHGERRLVAYLVPQTGAEVSATAVRAGLLGQVPEHLIPADVIGLAALPQTAGGKLDRRKLPAWEPPVVRRAEVREVPMKGLERRLGQIWESVFGVSNLSRHDDFFELGGTSIQSAQIVSRVQERFDVALPASILIQHSTIAKLAAVVSGEALDAASDQVVLLNEGNQGRPLFLVHSGEGDVAVYGQLARRLAGRTVYGLQSIGLDGTQAPLLTIPEMARCYVRELLARDPEGPHLVGGARMGALVAFEMARQLRRAGRTVGLVAMFDFSPRGRPSALGRLIAPVTAGRDRLRVLRWRAIRRWRSEHRERWLPCYRAFIAKMNCHSRHDYRPEPYPGPITVFVTSDRLKGNWETRLAQFSREARVITIPGDRFNLFGPPAVDLLAARLREHL